MSDVKSARTNVFQHCVKLPVTLDEYTKLKVIIDDLELELIDEVRSLEVFLLQDVLNPTNGLAYVLIGLESEVYLPTVMLHVGVNIAKVVDVKAFDFWIELN